MVSEIKMIFQSRVFLHILVITETTEISEYIQRRNNHIFESFWEKFFQLFGGGFLILFFVGVAWVDDIQVKTDIFIVYFHRGVIVLIKNAAQWLLDELSPIFFRWMEIKLVLADLFFLFLWKFVVLLAGINLSIFYKIEWDVHMV